jgi:hypothetical protein
VCGREAILRKTVKSILEIKMADNELDETTANLYVDFLHRRAVSDMAKIRKRSPKSGLAEVEEEFEDESELESHKKSQRKVSDDRFAYVQDHGILKEGPSRAFVHRSQAQRGSGNKKHLVENPPITVK